MKAKWIEFSPDVAALIEVAVCHYLAIVEADKADLERIVINHETLKADEIYVQTCMSISTLENLIEILRADQTIALGALMKIDS